MHPLYNGSQVTVRPVRKPTAGTPGYFSESNDSEQPSYPGQDWFNDVIDEFKNALLAMGITYDSAKLDHLALAFINASGGVRNLFEANQNFNVEGADGTLNSSPQTFMSGQEFSFGWVVTGGADLVDVKIVDGEVTATSGKIQRAYRKDSSGLINATSVYGSVTSKNGDQTYAETLAANGIELTEDSSNIYLTIDFAKYVSGISIVCLSNRYGKSFAINDDDSERFARGGFLYRIVNGIHCKLYPDGKIDMFGGAIALGNSEYFIELPFSVVDDYLDKITFGTRHNQGTVANQYAVTCVTRVFSSGFYGAQANFSGVYTSNAFNWSIKGATLL